MLAVMDGVIYAEETVGGPGGPENETEVRCCWRVLSGVRCVSVEGCSARHLPPLRP